MLQSNNSSRSCACISCVSPTASAALIVAGACLLLEKLLQICFHLYVARLIAFNCETILVGHSVPLDFKINFILRKTPVFAERGKCKQLFGAKGVNASRDQAPDAFLRLIYPEKSRYRSVGKIKVQLQYASKWISASM